MLANKEAGDNRVLALLLAAHAADQSGDREASLHYLADIAKLPENSSSPAICCWPKARSARKTMCLPTTILKPPPKPTRA